MLQNFAIAGKASEGETKWLRRDYRRDVLTKMLWGKSALGKSAEKILLGFAALRGSGARFI
jgi:hypothetical protein